MTSFPVRMDEHIVLGRPTNLCFLFPRSRVALARLALFLKMFPEQWRALGCLP